MITLRQTPLPCAVGNTHADSVMPTVRSSALLSATVTQSFTPSNDRALPYLPCVVQVAPEMVPVRPLPVTSTAVVPVPALKLQEAIKPGGSTRTPASYVAV